MAMKIKTRLFILAGFIVIVEAIDIARIVAFSGSRKIANLVNEAGLVRGGTQRLFKLKLAGADPEIITKAKQKTKQRVSGLVRGDTEQDLR